MILGLLTLGQNFAALMHMSMADCTIAKSWVIYQHDVKQLHVTSNFLCQLG